ncbi:MAG: neutral/alkaline non-lysosomal ceramidase N-terminal domain-containing protein [Planctomycetota bacterium]
MRIGFGRVDITPRIGVELCGFGAFLNRHSTAIRDRLWARAMAIEVEGTRLVIVSCDLVGIGREMSAKIRAAVMSATGLPASAIMVHSTHTHSGPTTMSTSGWGDADPPYCEILPTRVARACIDAVGNLREATLAHAEVPCEGIGQNREYDRDNLPLDEVMRPGWRPNKPELTDTTCHVLTATADGTVIGFVSYFGCHPVVCCSDSRHIHGDFCGVATNLLETEFSGATGMFLQGAQGDVNSRVVHKPAAESLRALDIIAGEYAAAVRVGIQRAQPIVVDQLAAHQRLVRFTRKPWDLAKLRGMLAETEASIVAAPDESAQSMRINMVHLIALRRMVADMEAGRDMSPPIELQGFRLGPIALLASPFETFQAIKNDVVKGSAADIPLVLSFANDSVGYAADHTAAARGGYAADMVPIIYGSLPYAQVHTELVAGLLAVDVALANSIHAIA